MLSQLDKFIAQSNQCITAIKGSFSMVIKADTSLRKILDLLQTLGILYYVPIVNNTKSEAISSKEYRVFFILLNDNRPLISKMIRLSKSSRRIYLTNFSLKKFYYSKQNVFYMVISTSKGLKLINHTHFWNSKCKIGGEPLFVLIF